MNTPLQEQLAHWIYTDEEWKKFITIQKKLDRDYKKNFILIVFIFVIVMDTIFSHFDPLHLIIYQYVWWGVVTIFMVGVIISTFIMNIKLKIKAETIIYMNGVKFGNKIYSWSISRCYFENHLKKIIHHSSANLEYLEIDYSYPNGRQRSRDWFYIPIPQNQEQITQEIVYKLTKHLN